MKRYLTLALALTLQSHAATYVCENGKTKLSFTDNSSSVTGELITHEGTRGETAVTFSGYALPSAQTSRVPSPLKPIVYKLVDSWGSAAKLSVTHTRITSATYTSEGQVQSFANCTYVSSLPPVIIHPFPDSNRIPNCRRCGDANFL